MWQRCLYGMIFCILIFSSCSKEEKTYELTQEQITVLKSIPPYCIIAHRGTGEWAPEGSEAAMRWARNAGATYLECDIQRTKDGYLVVFHDETLRHNTNADKIYPQSEDKSICDFTLEELLTLDIGSSYNQRNQAHARQSFLNQGILTLEDVIKIAEGYRIKRDKQSKRIYSNTNGKIVMLYEPDFADNGNRPGIYPETKFPELYPGIERDIKLELERLGWYADNISSLKQIDVYPGKISTANTSARVIIQSLSDKSLNEFKNIFPRLIPLCYLVNVGKNTSVSTIQYKSWVNNAVKNGAVIFGPSISGGKSDYKDLLQSWMYDLIKEKKMLVHAYTFNDEDQLNSYLDKTDGFITGQVKFIKSTLTNNYNISKPNLITDITESQILEELGY